MDDEYSHMTNRFLTYRRVMVAVTYVSLLGFIFAFEYCSYYKLTIQSEAICIVFGLIFLIGFYFGFIRTGLWQFIHKPLRQLNEKEIEQTSRALRISYSVFAIFSISLLLAFSLTEYTIDVVTVIGLLILAHTLPAAVIAWTKKSI